MRDDDVLTASDQQHRQQKKMSNIKEEQNDKNNNSNNNNPNKKKKKRKNNDNIPTYAPMAITNPIPVRTNQLYTHNDMLRRIAQLKQSIAAERVEQGQLDLQFQFETAQYNTTTHMLQLQIQTEHEHCAVLCSMLGIGVGSNGIDIGYITNPQHHQQQRHKQHTKHQYNTPSSGAQIHDQQQPNLYPPPNNPHHQQHKRPQPQPPHHPQQQQQPHQRSRHSTGFSSKRRYSDLGDYEEEIFIDQHNDTAHHHNVGYTQQPQQQHKQSHYSHQPTSTTFTQPRLPRQSHPRPRLPVTTATVGHQHKKQRPNVVAHPSDVHLVDIHNNHEE